MKNNPLLPFSGEQKSQEKSKPYFWKETSADKELAFMPGVAQCSTNDKDEVGRSEPSRGFQGKIKTDEKSRGNCYVQTESLTNTTSKKLSSDPVTSRQFFGNEDQVSEEKNKMSGLLCSAIDYSKEQGSEHGPHISNKLELSKEKGGVDHNEWNNAAFQESSPNDTFLANYFQPAQDKEKQHFFTSEVDSSSMTEFSLKDQRVKEEPDQNLTEKESITQIVKYHENRPRRDSESKSVTLQKQSNEEFKKELNISFKKSILQSSVNPSFVLNVALSLKGHRSLNRKLFLQHLATLGSQFRHFALTISEFTELSINDKRKLLAMNTPIFVNFLFGMFLAESDPKVRINFLFWEKNNIETLDGGIDVEKFTSSNRLLEQLEFFMDSNVRKRFLILAKELHRIPVVTSGSLFYSILFHCNKSMKMESPMTNTMSTDFMNLINICSEMANIFATNVSWNLSPNSENGEVKNKRSQYDSFTLISKVP